MDYARSAGGHVVPIDVPVFDLSMLHVDKFKKFQASLKAVLKQLRGELVEFEVVVLREYPNCMVPPEGKQVWEQPCVAHPYSIGQTLSEHGRHFLNVCGAEEALL
ncbi:MAG TPA: hypothetical protein EYP46_01935 [Hadesarchaea archaeon]|nr:hypothetical protein [Hadesarchaea archaeon]